MAKGKSGSNTKTASLCAAGSGGCKKPTGSIDWLQCDGCQQWYHCTCVKVNPNDAAEIIYHCKSCKPKKEEEYSEIKVQLKDGLSKIVKAHPNFATGPIARKYFATKGKFDEYQAEPRGVPLTLMELSLKIDGVFQSTDHFAEASKKMTARMKEYLKTEQHDEIARISKAIEKLIADSRNKKKTPNGKKVSVRDEAESIEEEKVPAAKRKSPARRQPTDSAKKIKTAPNKEQKSTSEKEEVLRALKAPAEHDIKINPNQSNRNRRMKKLNKWPENTTKENAGQKTEALTGAAIQGVKAESVSSTGQPAPQAAVANPVSVAATQRQGQGPRRPAMLVPRAGPTATKTQPPTQGKVAQAPEILKQVQIAAKSEANSIPRVEAPQTKGRASRKRRGKSNDLDEEVSPPEEKISRQKGGGQKEPEIPSATIPDNILDDGEDLGKPVKLSDLNEMEPIFTTNPKPSAPVLLSPNQIRATTPQKSHHPMVVTIQPQVIPIQPQVRPTIGGALQRSPVPTIITSPIQGTGTTPPVFFKVLKGNSFVQLPSAQDGSQKSVRPILSPNKSIRGTASFIGAGAPTRPQVIFPVKEVVRMTAPSGQQPRSIIRPAPPRAIAPNQGPVLMRAVASVVPPKSPQLPVVPLPRTSLTNAQPPQSKSSAPLMNPNPPATGLKPAESSLTKAFVWKSSDRTQFKLSARFNFDLFREYQSKHPQKDVRFALATIVTEDRVNEFSFHLTQKKDAPLEDKPWQLGVRSKNPSDHVWHLKVKVDPPIFLVNNQKFEQITNNYEIPKKVSDKAVVDYELLLMGKAAASGYSSANKASDVSLETSKAQPSPKKAS